MAIKVGVIGAGGMLQYHAAGFRQAGAEIVAVADPAPGAAAKAAEKWGIANAYESVDAMLAECKELDAVSIIVPNKFHAPLALQCLKAGKHVFCEKPPALNASEVEEMIAAAEEGRQEADVQLQQPRPSRVAGDEELLRGRHGRHHQLRPGEMDPPHRHPRLRRLVHHQGTLRRRSAHRPAPHDRPRALFHGLSGARPRARPTPSTPSSPTRNSKARGAFPTAPTASPTSRPPPTDSSPSRPARF